MKRLFDTTCLQGTAFKPLADEQVFKTIQAAHGFVSWMDGEIDCTPEYMYENSYTYEEEFVI